MKAFKCDNWDPSFDPTGTAGNNSGNGNGNQVSGCGCVVLILLVVIIYFLTKGSV